MARYKTKFDRRVKKDFKTIDVRAAKRIKAAIAKLSDNPHPPGPIKLKGTGLDYFKIKVGDYRAVYTIEDDILLVIVVRVGHRKMCTKGCDVILSGITRYRVAMKLANKACPSDQLP